MAIRSLDAHRPKDLPDPGTSASPESSSSSAGTLVERTLRTTPSLPPITWRNLHKQVRWFSLAVVTLTPLVALYGSFTTPLKKETFLFCIFYYVFNMIGITAGYHRLWSHRSYTASLPLQCLLACAGAGAVQGSIRFWARLHRSHHRYTDTPLDPYSAHLGFWHSHVGWMLMKPRIKPGRADAGDLTKEEGVVGWQHRRYFWFAGMWGVVVPVCCCGLGWGDWWGGWYWAGFARMVVVHHSVFSVNSLAHYLGSTPYSDKHSPRDHVLTALLTLGEGYHNFHHQFPSDYRNAVRWYQYDPTKWFISLCALFQLATNLRRFRESEIQKCRLTMEMKRLKGVQEEVGKRWGWGVDARELKIWTWREFQKESETRPTLLVSGFIHDLSLTAFIHEHPGGSAILKAYVGKDATSAFHGGVYDHSDAAVNILATLRVGILRHGMEVISEDSEASGVVNEGADVPPCRRLQIVEVSRMRSD